MLKSLVPQRFDDRLDFLLVRGDGRVHLSDRALDEHSTDKAKALAGRLKGDHRR
jgi:hypothetical protein